MALTPSLWTQDFQQETMKVELVSRQFSAFKMPPRIHTFPRERVANVVTPPGIIIWG